MGYEEFLFGAQQRLQREARGKYTGVFAGVLLIKMVKMREGKQLDMLHREMIQPYFQCLTGDDCQVWLLANAEGEECNMCAEMSRL